MTHFSPNTVAIVDTRTSMPRSSTSVANWPSWARRRSTMFMLARILTRLTRAPAIEIGSARTSWRAPSMRNRTRMMPSLGSRWMSEARSRSASVTSMVTTLAMGESAPMDSSRPASAPSRGRAGGLEGLHHPVHVGQGPVGPVQGLAGRAGWHQVELDGPADGPFQLCLHAGPGVADRDLDHAVDVAQRHGQEVAGDALGQPSGDLRVGSLAAEVADLDVELLRQDVGQLPLVEGPGAHQLLTDAQPGLGLLCERLLELLVTDEALRHQEGTEEDPSWRGRLPARIRRLRHRWRAGIDLLVVSGPQGPA